MVLADVLVTIRLSFYDIYCRCQSWYTYIYGYNDVIYEEETAGKLMDLWLVYAIKEFHLWLNQQMLTLFSDES